MYFSSVSLGPDGLQSISNRIYIPRLKYFLILFVQYHREHFQYKVLHGFLNTIGTINCLLSPLGLRRKTDT